MRIAIDTKVHILVKKQKGFLTLSEHYPFSVKPLPYAYDALEPFIDTETMRVHHDQHYAAYVARLNEALADYPLYQNWSLSQLLTHLPMLPPDIRKKVRDNGGGVYNHERYFDGMSPNAAHQPTGALLEAVNRDFGSVEEMKKQFQDAGMNRFGSGWAWLVLDGGGRLAILSTPNQDVPPLNAACPVMLMDVWEHAYYLKHKNRRQDYIGDWFNAADFDKASKNFESCAASISEKKRSIF